MSPRKVLLDECMPRAPPRLSWKPHDPHRPTSGHPAPIGKHGILDYCNPTYSGFPSWKIPFPEMPNGGKENSGSSSRRPGKKISSCSEREFISAWTREALARKKQERLHENLWTAKQLKIRAISGRGHPNDHVEDFITPADEKHARVGWISAAHPPGGGDGGCASLIHPTAPNRGCCFIVSDPEPNSTLPCPHPYN
uniref:Uncharacterized protein n=1 Tax=Candidatus Kentrum sp. UNK TaxID=2126344 RepID=A0A451AZ08_9GAMM|nr:MAG: hypothetical protein BECKUNK1418G_GA0071005_10572 [Candidatus Kentron sp. UNK]VFK71289.1 MAG: hypothetical protein BECKUNK1418H_GA0071006_10592 [Candidatus Kentron sp. UNK]